MLNKCRADSPRIESPMMIFVIVFITFERRILPFPSMFCLP